MVSTDRIRELDFADRVREMAERFKRRVDHIKTEEATKTALVMPFISNVWGYNVSDPTEVVPEFTADVGIKKGEKVDYAILKDDKPIILFECKRQGANLNEEQASQLHRYFAVVPTARFGVLTDGIIYRFYSDLERPNVMDAQPFLEFNMLGFEEDLAEELKKFTKSSFDLDQILTTASELKYTREIKRILAVEWSSPSDEFVRFLASRVRSGGTTKVVIQRFKETAKLALHQFLSDRARERLEQAASLEQKPQEQQTSSEAKEREEPGDHGVVTSEEELEGYYIVKAILREVVDAKRVSIRDVKSYCGILLDNNNVKPICRLHFNRPQKYLGLFDEQKHEERVPIDGLDDIYKYTDRLKATVGYYDKGISAVNA